MVEPKLKHRTLQFVTELDKCFYLNERAHSHDQASALVQEKARAFLNYGSALSALSALHRFVRDYVKYRHDPGGREEFADAHTVLSRRFDDCDGKASTVVALAVALGKLRPEWHIEARTVPHWRLNHFAHVSAEMRYLGSDAHGRADKNGWLCSDPIVGGLEFGMTPEDGRDPKTGHITTV